MDKVNDKELVNHIAYDRIGDGLYLVPTSRIVPVNIVFNANIDSREQFSDIVLNSSEAIDDYVKMALFNMAYELGNDYKQDINSICPYEVAYWKLHDVSFATDKYLLLSYDENNHTFKDAVTGIVFKEFSDETESEIYENGFYNNVEEGIINPLCINVYDDYYVLEYDNYTKKALQDKIVNEEYKDDLSAYEDEARVNLVEQYEIVKKVDALIKSFLSKYKPEEVKEDEHKRC